MPLIHIKRTISRPRWKWYLSGATVLVGTLLLFSYITFVQASAAFVEGGATLVDFQFTLGERLLKCLLLVLTMGLFLFFFMVQDYRMAFNSLLERLNFERAGSSEDGIDSDDPDSAELLLQSNRSYNDELALIEHSVESMLNENRAYRDRLDVQRVEMRDDYLLRLLKGWVKVTPTTRRICKSFDLDDLENEYLIAITGISSAENSSVLHEDAVSMAYLLMQHQLRQMLLHLLKVHAVTVDGKLTFIVTPEPAEDLKDPQTLSDLISALKLSQQMVFDETRITLQTALGAIDSGFDEVSHSYVRAADSFEYTQLIGDGCAVALQQKQGVRERAESLDDDEQLGSIWTRLERQFLNCIEAEEYSNAKEHFENMLGSGYVSQAPTLALAQHRMLNLTNLLIDVLEKAGVTAGWNAEELVAAQNKVLACQTLSRLRHTALALFDELDYQTSAKRKQSSYLRIMDIIDHVEANYPDANLCVNQIAASFDLNPSYLSRSFKKLMNIGLADYIRHMRITKAKELLQNDEVSVKQAAELVGFSNVLTMNRAFRKEEGTTAGRLRKALPDGDENEPDRG